MISKNRLLKLAGVLVPRGIGIAAVGLSVITAGCSADVTRFDKPPFGLTESGAGSPVPRPSQPLNSNGDQSYNAPAPRFGAGGGSGGYEQVGGGYEPRGGGYEPTATNGPGAVRTAALPDIDSGAPAVARAPNFDPRPARTVEPTFGARPPAAAAAAAALSKPQRVAEIEVQRGDTLYGLSRRHSVSLNELMRVNGLTKPNLKPGQKLQLPSGARVNSAPPATAKVAKSAAPVNAPASWGGAYTMVRGDSLYKVARKFGVKTADLQRFNAIGDPRRVRPGTVLKVPGSGNGASIKVASRTPVATKPPSRTVRLSEPKAAGGSGVSVINSKPAAVPGSPRVVQSVRVSPPKVTAADKTKLRWPVKGKVISKFGRRSDGTQNDGINLEVPLGTDVKAAENGVVAYSGSELRGYGKLVLVRHDNGWVTAYAHNKDVLVKRGDKVKRGQVIAKAGKTGQVDRPQVHFELRRDAKPVDPIPYLETL